MGWSEHSVLPVNSYGGGMGVGGLLHSSLMLGNLDEAVLCTDPLVRRAPCPRAWVQPPAPLIPCTPLTEVIAPYGTAVKSRRMTKRGCRGPHALGSPVEPQISNTWWSGNGWRRKTHKTHWVWSKNGYCLTHTGGLASVEASGNPAQHKFLGEVIKRMWLLIDTCVEPRQSEAPPALPCLWNRPGAHCPHSKSSKDIALREGCC